MTEYPEHEKLQAVKERSQAIGEFLEWMESERETPLTLASYGKGEGGIELLFPANISTERLLAEFFDIDLGKLEQEKRQMLAEIRKEQANDA
jgi:hypothetical protein